jgi:hypothetical protein
MSLFFNLIQNWEGEYPKMVPYQVIELVDQNHPSFRGYSSCDEMGRTNYLPGIEVGKTFSRFLSANEDTELAFIGEKIEKDGRTWLIAKYDPSYEELKEVIL